ncbi:MAG TPA: signal peptidase I [Acidimicrobiaceae bacterium]|nr:signal peptidase I [Acidimicrobiaceae bacterium]|tara:strand:- start:20 stop:589 length:570 start_codon:yes stop_codon:yes gene_type:complete
MGSWRGTSNRKVTWRAASLKSFREWSFVVGIALIAAFGIRATLIQTYFIPSESMTPTLQVGDRLMVYKLAFSLGDVERGDLVVFNRPPALDGTEMKDFVKRVVGLAGEQISADNGLLLINGEPLDEPYLTSGVSTQDFSEIVIPEGHVFVMGDNRPNSRDSRSFGPIDEDLLVGEVFIRLWPMNRFGLP